METGECFTEVSRDKSSLWRDKHYANIETKRNFSFFEFHSSYAWSAMSGVNEVINNIVNS